LRSGWNVPITRHRLAVDDARPHRQRVGGTNVARLPPFRRNIGLVFQDYALFPHKTVANNVDYGMRQHGVARPDRERRRGEHLRLVRL
jgi:ABC-type Fe3+/spermidine/putrescine transport system ATPase subunit